jgi:endoglucanase
MNRILLKTWCILFLAFTAGSLQAASAYTWPGKTLRGANVTVSITDADLAYFRENWRGNSVRILMNDALPGSPPYRVTEETRKKLFDTVDLCLKNGLYTILAFSASFDDNDKFFSNTEFRARYTEFWQEIARRYAGSRGFAYDLMNEPHDNLAETQWLPFARELTRAIRQIDSVHTIVVEPPGWGWPDGFDRFGTTGDANTVYAFHFYGPMDFTHQRGTNYDILGAEEWRWKSLIYPGFLQGEYWDKNKLRSSFARAIAFRDKYKVTLWCGEFGATRWALGAEQWYRDLIDILEEERIGWSYYSYREWYAMDIEMDPAARLARTARTETPLVRLFKGYFAKNAAPCDFNQDGYLDPADARSLLFFQIVNPGRKLGDYNGDGRVSVADILSLLLDQRRGACLEQ